MARNIRSSAELSPAGRVTVGTAASYSADRTDMFIRFEDRGFSTTLTISRLQAIAIRDELNEWLPSA